MDLTSNVDVQMIRVGNDDSDVSKSQQMEAYKILTPFERAMLRITASIVDG